MARILLARMTIVVVWPDGAVERWHDVTANQMAVLVRGSGKSAD